MTEKLNTGSHDLPVSDALATFMNDGLGRHPPRRPGSRVPQRRLDRQAARPCSPPVSPASAWSIPSGTLKTRSNDSDYRFRPHSAFAYLTGRPGARRRPGHRAGRRGHAVRPAALAAVRAGRRQEFYRDRRYGEFWVGRRPDLAEAEALYQIECAPSDEAGRRARRARAGAARGGRVGGRPGRAARRRRRAGVASSREMRLIKDDVGGRPSCSSPSTRPRGASRTSCGRCPPRCAHRRGERYLEGVFELRARLEGNAVGYDSIVASGAHACVLHWIRNDGRLDRERSAAARRGRRDRHPLHRRHHPHPAAVRPLQPDPAPGLRAGLRGAERGHRRAPAGRELPRLPPGGHAGHRRGPARLGRAADQRRRGDGPGERPVPPLHAVQQRPHARPGRARLRQAARGGLPGRRAGGGPGAHRRARPLPPAGRPDAAAGAARHRRPHRGRPGRSPPTAPA